jgi:hypothetical protein
MSNQPPPQAKPEAPKGDPRGPRLPVLRLDFPVERQMPGGHFSFTLESSGPAVHATQKRYSIDYLPREGAYEVRYFEPNKTEPTEVCVMDKGWAKATLLIG